MLNKLQALREEREQGFTLIELLVVILIIGILAAIAIPAFLNQRKSAVDSSVTSDVTGLAKVVDTEAVKGHGQALTVAGDTSMGEVLTVNGVDITDKVEKGKDTDLKLEGTTNGYKIIGTSDGGDEAKTGIVYDSLEGGLQSGASGESGNPEAGGEEAGGDSQEVDMTPGQATKSFAFTYDGNSDDKNEYTGNVHVAGNTVTVTFDDKSINKDIYISLTYSVPGDDMAMNTISFDGNLTITNGVATATMNDSVRGTGEISYLGIY